MRLLLCLLCLSAAGCTSAYAGDFKVAGQDGGCFTLGADAGNTIKVTTITPNTQFMVSTNYSVNYRECLTTTCTADQNDAPIAASAQVDLCMRTGYSTVSFYHQYDGGVPSVCVYNVTPQTVCQIQ